MKGLHVESLHVYPLKGARGTRLEHAEILRGGIRHDRRFMLVDANGAFISQRSHPQLALVEAVIGNTAITIAGVSVPFTPEGPPRVVRVWKDDIEAIEVATDAAAAVSEAIGAACSLVFIPDNVVRQVDLRYGEPGDRVGFADGFPLLFASTASLADLEARAGFPIAMDRFRPNVVVSGAEPWEEETHPRVRVGELTFRLPKRCDRCAVVLVDQATGKSGKEPLAALSTFRRVEQKVFFAMNAIPEREGFIAVGDSVAWLSDAVEHAP